MRKRIAEGHLAVDHRHDQAADDVDRSDDQAGDGVAAHKLAGAVHGAVELHLGRQRLAARARLVGGDQAGAEVGVDRHLLAGQRIQGEARRDFGDAHRTVIDDDELNRDEDQEDDDADDEIAANDELAERRKAAA